MPEKSSLTPRQIVEEWVKRFNQGNAASIAELYDDNAVNHQITQEPVTGRAAIQAMFAAEFTAAEMICIPEIIHEAGDVAILEWRDPVGLRGCGLFTVKNDLIIFQRGYWDKLSFLKLHNLPLE